MSIFALPVMTLFCDGFLSSGPMSRRSTRDRAGEPQIGGEEIGDDLAAHQAGLRLHVEIHRHAGERPVHLHGQRRPQVVSLDRRQDARDLRQRRVAGDHELVDRRPQVGLDDAIDVQRRRRRPQDQVLEVEVVVANGDAAAQPADVEVRAVAVEAEVLQRHREPCTGAYSNPASTLSPSMRSGSR